MDGSFACPECGSSVEVPGLAPGRQVRCEFCRRLLEVPYFPRVPAFLGKRRRYGRPKWVAWAWSAIGLAVAVSLVAGSLRFWRKHHQSTEDRSIEKMIESSQIHEAAGRFNEALIELDAALALARNVAPARRARWEGQRKRREDLARRDAEEVLDRLVRHELSSFPLGDWLDLIARCDHDPDLQSLKPKIGEQFRLVILQQADAELASARHAFELGKVLASLQSCERIAKLLAHLDPNHGQTVRCDTEELVARLLAAHGVVVELLHGDFVSGSESSYVASMVPLAVKALEAKDYLPYRPGSPWAGLWKHARYHLQLDVSERLEGHYPSTDNRLTRIDVHVTLTAGGVQKWETRPTVRTSVPLPNLPAFVSERLEVKPGRSDAIERLLYNDARGRIDERVALALSNVRPCCP
jgi:hypothetical protein